ncbi:23S rRNA (guanosine(2251)-2'-O)-methyltransferase RlmB [Candidatus Bathyarchaeota archaeon]|nr:23S rRNA (guanosine(2251)-2'-O)-methyltransferase RlmB [Candidatus Bathyarchaeota archaeon]
MSQVEGRNPVYETIKRGGVKKLVISKSSLKEQKIIDIIDLGKKNRIPIDVVEKEYLDKISETDHHQGVIALVKIPGYASLKQVINKSTIDTCILILDGVQDPQNLGSILRTSDASGVNAVLLPKKESVGLNSTVLRVSMGAGTYVPVIRDNIYPAIKLLKNEGFQIIGLDVSGKKDYWQHNLTGATVLIFGGEGKGISPTLLEKCDTVLSIPMMGKIPNLNVGVSAAIVLYERLRQKKINSFL